MPDRITTVLTAGAARQLRRGRILLCVALCLAAAACASTSDEGGWGGPMFFADSGKYLYHNCEQLATAAKNQSTRQRELKELIDKAEQSAGGAFVGLLAYRTDYVAVSEDLRVIGSTQRSKNCRASPQSSTAIQ